MTTYAYMSFHNLKMVEEDCSMDWLICIRASCQPSQQQWPCSEGWTSLCQTFRCYYSLCWIRTFIWNNSAMFFDLGLTWVWSEIILIVCAGVKWTEMANTWSNPWTLVLTSMTYRISIAWTLFQGRQTRCLPWFRFWAMTNTSLHS